MEDIVNEYPELESFNYIDDEIDLMSLKERTLYFVYMVKAVKSYDVELY